MDPNKYNEKSCNDGGKENHETNMWADICNGYCSMKMNEGIYNKFISPDILTVIKVHIFGMAWVCGGMDGEGQMLLEGKPGGERKKGRPIFK